MFLQSIYYRMQLDKVCRKLRDKYKFQYDINAILSDLTYARVLEPASKRSSFSIASEFLEAPTYELHDVYRALDVLGEECDFIQSEIYKNSHLLGSRNDKILYTCESILHKLRQMDFALIQEQGFLPLYTRDSLTDALHEISGFRTDYEFITKQQMKTIQKKSKGR